jgi:hypothetical protein
MATFIDNVMDTPRSPVPQSFVQENSPSSPSGRTENVDDGYQPSITPIRGTVANALSELRRSNDPFPAPTLPVATTISTDQLQHLIQNIADTIKSSTQPSVPKDDNPFAIARAEFYISQGLAYKFDGTHEKLAPWIKKFKALRRNALWRKATYLQHEDRQYDILTEFTKIKLKIDFFFTNTKTALYPG